MAYIITCSAFPQAAASALGLTAIPDDDASHVPTLLDQLTQDPASFMADGAYDRAATYDAILARNPSARFIVPPCKGSVPGPTATISPTPRDLHVLAVDEHGRMNWQKASGYNTRSKVEAAISRYKRVIGDTSKSRHDNRRGDRSCNCHQVPQPHEPTRACDIHSNSMIEAASTSRHASQSLHATRSQFAPSSKTGLSGLIEIDLRTLQLVEHIIIQNVIQGSNAVAFSNRCARKCSQTSPQVAPKLLASCMSCTAS